MSTSEKSNDKCMKKGMQSPDSRSPFSKSQTGKNLTGTARHLRDLAADVHGIIQRWNDKTLEGMDILKCIAEEKSDETFTIQLQDYCDKLENVCSSLDDLIKNLEKIVHQVNTLMTLNGSTTKLFVTWPLSSFGHTVELIYKGYSNEMQIKREVLENIAHCNRESQKMLYLSAWLYQPLLPQNLTILLEAMLTETGHR